MMKKYILLFALAFVSTYAFCDAYEESSSVKDSLENRATYCRYVPERKGDFAWENDKIAFRTYSKQSLKTPSMIMSGFDCWFKRVSYPIINKWYDLNAKGTSYHRDHGEGLDCYNVGASRGCGGSALYLDSEYHVSAYFDRFEIIENSANKSVFKLYYPPIVWHNDSIIEIKTITIKKGDFYFKCEDEFISKHQLPVLAVGIGQHGAKGEVNGSDNGWISYWEPQQDSMLGTALWCPKKDFLDKDLTSFPSDKDANFWLHIKLCNNKAVYYAGFTWLKAGLHSSNKEWLDYVKEVSRQMR